MHMTMQIVTLRDKDNCNFLGAISGLQRFPPFPFNYLEGQAAPQNSFVFIYSVISIRIARGSFLFVFNALRKFLRALKGH
jgi:hypothetical protein